MCIIFIIKIHSKSTVLRLLIRCSHCGICDFSMFWCALRCVHSSFAIILMGKRELVVQLCVLFLQSEYIQKHHSKAVDSLLIVTPIVGFFNCSMFCCALFCVHSSFASILMGKRELVVQLCVLFLQSKYIQKHHSKAVDSLLIVTPILGFCNCSLFCCALFCVHSSFASILMGKRELVVQLCVLFLQSKYIQKHHSKAVNSLLIVTPIMGFCNCSIFCCALVCVHSSFASILMGKRELVVQLCVFFYNRNTSMSTILRLLIRC